MKKLSFFLAAGLLSMAAMAAETAVMVPASMQLHSVRYVAPSARHDKHVKHVRHVKHQRHQRRAHHGAMQHKR